MSKSTNKVQNVANVVSSSILYSSLPIAIVWWFIGVQFFGFISGPEATLSRWLLYMLVALTSSAVILGSIIRKLLAKNGLKITQLHAFIIAFISPIFLFISMGVITLTQYADGNFDGEIAFAGFILSLITTIFLSNALTKPQKNAK